MRGRTAQPDWLLTLVLLAYPGRSKSDMGGALGLLQRLALRNLALVDRTAGLQGCM
jgi:hypothetical protein